eukprot:scaffold286_cov169-Amphora_coffeaeformis.AAC.8
MPGQARLRPCSSSPGSSNYDAVCGLLLDSPVQTIRGYMLRPGRPSGFHQPYHISDARRSSYCRGFSAFSSCERGCLFVELVVILYFFGDDVDVSKNLQERPYQHCMLRSFVSAVVVVVWISPCCRVLHKTPAA